MRVLFEEELGALLAAGASSRAGAPLSCLVDLHLGRRGAGGDAAEQPVDGLADASASLAEDVLGRLAARRAGRLDLAVFGVEALPELDRVVELSRRLQRGCLAAGIGYAAHAIVGGALLEATAARRLSRAGVSRLQVTLEPRRPAPGARRSAREGPGGWRGTLDAVAQASAEIRIVLRVSPDASCDFEALVDALEERGLVAAGPAVSLYLAHPAPHPQQARELIAMSHLLEAEQIPSRALPQ